MLRHVPGRRVLAALLFRFVMQVAR